MISFVYTSVYFTTSTYYFYDHLTMKKVYKYLVFFGIFLMSTFIALKLYHLSFIRQATEKTSQATIFAQPDTTEVFVVGTLHKTTDKVGYDDLYNLLETIKPNIILFEVDSTHFDDKMNRKSKWRKMKLPPFLDILRQSNLEEVSVQKYLFHNKFAIVRPYEWSLRDRFHKENHILTTPDKVFQKLDELNKADKLDVNQKHILENYYFLSTELEKFGDSTIYQINTLYQDSIARETQNAQYHKIKTIIDSNDSLKEFREFYKVNEAYWDIRNKAMAKNIQTFIKLFPKSRIVVLNGYYHRYYLRQELLDKQQELNFKLLNVDR